MPLWRNWQTRTTQNRVRATSYRFDSDQRHKEKIPFKGFFYLGEIISSGWLNRHFPEDTQ